MSYQVLARKYRPQRFADVVGQDHVTQTLSQAIATGRIHQAYLFCGPRGTGKTTIARIFAKCLNCTGGPRVDFEDSDPRCVEIVEGRSLDVIEIDGASNNGVEHIRDLRDTARFAPASSKYKIYLIDEVHMLSTSAFNALLKTLEEPPAHVKFLFATTDPEKVLPTILSRCQRFDLRRIPVRLIVDHLGLIARQEQVEIDEAALHAIARGADGGLRDAESVLDQLISFCGGRIAESDVLSMFGLAAQNQLIALSGAILAGDLSVALRQLDELARNGKDLGRLLGDLLSHFRNLLLWQVTRGGDGMLEVSETMKAGIAEQAGQVPTEALGRVMETLTESENLFRLAASKKIFVEVAVMKAIQARQAVSLDAVLRQLQQLRQEGGAGGMASPGAAAVTPAPVAARPVAPAASSPAPTTQPTRPASPSPAPSAAPAPAPAPASTPPPAAAPAPGGLGELWAQVVEAVGRVSPFTKSYLLEAHPVSLANRVFTIGFDPEFADHIALVDNAKNREVIHTKLAELGHPGHSVKFVKAARPDGVAALPSTPPVAPPAAPVPAAAPGADATRMAARPGRPAATGSGPAASPPASSSASSSAAVEPQKLDPDTFKNDPLIKQALEIFKAQIVEVRG